MGLKKDNRGSLLAPDLVTTTGSVKLAEAVPAVSFCRDQSQRHRVNFVVSQKYQTGYA